jgi:thioredoxin-like negative regulator of GroEL
MLLFFKSGKVVDQIIGAVPKTMIQSKFEQHAPAAQSAERGAQGAERGA